MVWSHLIHKDEGLDETEAGAGEGKKRGRQNREGGEGIERHTRVVGERRRRETE